MASSRVVFPLPEGTWVLTSPFGMRTHPITGEQKLHTGTDFAAPDGTPILAAADGVVTVAEFSGGYGGLIVIEHTIDGQTVATAYAHMWQTRHPRPRRRPRERRAAHRRCRLLGHEHRSPPALRGPPRRHQRRSHRRRRLAQPARSREPPHRDQRITSRLQHRRHARRTGGVDGDPDRLVDDPTSNGQITARMLHLYQQTLAAFPDTGWGCYSPRPGTKSEHPLGRACDITFGNQIGQRPNPAQLEAGWRVTNWMKDNADVLGVQYLIWQGQIWSLARDADGWRPYNGGGMHDPASITGGHYDHLHVTVKVGA